MMEYYNDRASGMQYLTMTYDQLYFLRRLYSMFNDVIYAEKHTPNLNTQVRVDGIIKDFRLILLAHAILPDSLKRNGFMVELQHVLGID